MVKRRQKSTRRRAAEPEPTIRAWQDDPATGFLMDRSVPNLAQRPLAYSFAGPTPKPASCIKQARRNFDIGRQLKPFVAVPISGRN